MYGPRQKHVDPFAKIPKWYQCSHTHVSGRHCTRRVIKSGTACEQCKPAFGSNRFCVECQQMLRAFEMKAL